MAVSLLLLTGVFLAVIAITLLWRMPEKPRKLQKSNTSKEPGFAIEEYSQELTGSPLHFIPEPIPELPELYGINRFVLLVRDPYWLYAYWEVTATTMDEISSGYNPTAWNESKPMLRVYDITGIDIFNGSNANSFFDCRLSENSTSWYIQGVRANKAYCVDFGKILPDGSFVTILRSNIVTTPRDRLSDNLDEEWMWIEGIYTGYQTGVSSPMIIEEIGQRMGKVPLGISSSGFRDRDQSENGGYYA